MTGRYATDTKVGTDQSRTEIERTLERFGATAFAYGRITHPRRQSQVMFELGGRRIRMSVPMPELEDFARTPTGLERSPGSMKNELLKEERRLWRSLLLVIKAKLESIGSGIETVEQAFMAHIVLPSGETVGEYIEPQLDRVYGSGDMPALLPGLGDRGTNK